MNLNKSQVQHLYKDVDYYHDIKAAVNGLNFEEVRKHNFAYIGINLSF